MQYATFPFESTPVPVVESPESQNSTNPGGAGPSSAGGTTGTAGAGEEKDPFLSLLEQIAENEHSHGGPSELDFFLDGLDEKA